MTELKITKGPSKVVWCTNSDGEYIVEKDDGSMKPIAFFRNSADDAKLFDDALTVFNETGLTPRQLLGQISLLMSACKAALPLADSSGYINGFNVAAAIEKVEGES